MSKMNFSITATTAAFLLFIVLCSLSLSLLFLQLYLLALTGMLIWMVITILKDGKPADRTFDQRFYEDADRGPRG